MEPNLSKPPPPGVVIFAAAILVIGAVALASRGVFVALRGDTFAGIKLIGFATMLLGGSFDPINCIWMCLPFTFRPVTVPTSYARLGLPLIFTGLIVTVIGIMGVHWHW